VDSKRVRRAAVRHHDAIRATTAAWSPTAAAVGSEDHVRELFSDRLEDVHTETRNLRLTYFATPGPSTTSGRICMRAEPVEVRDFTNRLAAEAGESESQAARAIRRHCSRVSVPTAEPRSMITTTPSPSSAAVMASATRAGVRTQAMIRRAGSDLNGRSRTLHHL